jgi:hypothetical protein
LYQTDIIPFSSYQDLMDTKTQDPRLVLYDWVA